MRCQRVRSLLSAYMDGEADPADSRMVEDHLAGCAECSREFALLRDTARMLATTPEVEPPAGLLEQIEVATIRHPSVWQRLGTALGSVPAYGRWAAATTATAAILLAILVARPPQQAVKQPAYAPQAPVAVTQPEVTPTSRPPTIVIAEQTLRHYPSHTSIREKAVIKPPARKLMAKIASAKVAREGTPLKEEVKVAGEEPPAAESPAAGASTNAASPASEPVKEVKVAQAATSPADHLQQQNDSLAKLRAELAARNKHKKLQVQTDPIEGRKVTVELASIRF